MLNPSGLLMVCRCKLFNFNGCYDCNNQIKRHEKVLPQHFVGRHADSGFTIIFLPAYFQQSFMLITVQQEPTMAAVGLMRILTCTMPCSRLHQAMKYGLHRVIYYPSVVIDLNGDGGLIPGRLYFFFLMVLRFMAGLRVRKEPSVKGTGKPILPS
jgi:hypothetical protein